MNKHTDAEELATSRLMAAFNQHTLAKGAGLPGRISAAASEIESARRQLRTAKADKAALDAMKAAMAKGRLVKC